MGGFYLFLATLCVCTHTSECGFHSHKGVFCWNISAEVLKRQLLFGHTKQWAAFLRKTNRAANANAKVFWSGRGLCSAFVFQLVCLVVTCLCCNEISIATQHSCPVQTRGFWCEWANFWWSQTPVPRLIKHLFPLCYYEQPSLFWYPLTGCSRLIVFLLLLVGVKALAKCKGMLTKWMAFRTWSKVAQRHLRHVQIHFC